MTVYKYSFDSQMIGANVIISNHANNKHKSKLVKILARLLK